jgi:hypothetical protein
MADELGAAAGPSPARDGAFAAPPPAAAPAPTTTAATGAAAGGEATKNDRYRAYRAQDDAWAATQEKSLAAAAEQKRCRDAAAIANDILDRDPEYYTARIAKSAGVETCSWYVSDERSRRVATRRKAEAEDDAKGASKAEKAKAAKAAPKDLRSNQAAPVEAKPAAPPAAAD